MNKRVRDNKDNFLKDMQIFHSVNLLKTDAARAIYSKQEINALCEFYAAILDMIDLNTQQPRNWSAKIVIKDCFVT